MGQQLRPKHQRPLKLGSLPGSDSGIKLGRRWSWGSSTQAPGGRRRSSSRLEPLTSNNERQVGHTPWGCWRSPSDPGFTERPWFVLVTSRWKQTWLWGMGHREGEERVPWVPREGCWPAPCPSAQFSSVQSLSHVQLFATPWTAARQASLSITNSRSLPKLMPIESVMPSNHLILCHPLLLLPSIFPSIRVLSSESALPIRWPNYWSFSFNISPSNEYSGLISFRIDRLDLLAVQGTLKNLLQHHSPKASILLCSAFFIVQLSHPYMTTGKTIALTRWNFVDKVMSLLFNMLSRLVITFLPRSKRLLISWLQLSSAVILEPKK